VNSFNFKFEPRILQGCKNTDLFINYYKFAHFIFSANTLKPRFLISHNFSVILTFGPVWYCSVIGRELQRGKTRERTKRVQL